MDKLIDLGMTKLFQLAEYVSNRCSLDKSEPSAPKTQPVVPTIRFTTEGSDKQVKYDARVSTLDHKQTRPNSQDNMVEGELFA